MWKKSYSVITKEITKEQIWKLTTDIDHWKDWDDSVEYSKLLGEFKIGEYFILKPKGAPKVKIKLIDIIRNQKFTDLTSFPLAKMYGEHLYEETKDGLKITVTMSVKGLLSKVWIKLVADDIVKKLPEDIECQIKNAKLIW
ncbi:polyketide cyclase [Chryseobacterium sp.]|uniref:polyketide cyclase n=1 Tax=Chryseobacterium sp. TaxID=1871047 RepID=UPI0025C45208|nr:polyketide cyclase [Chryseobacterium sp.]MBV8325238.1 polyketide cyclase [Chryseobacterium sp.]